MTPHVSISDLAQHVGQTVTLKGWLYNSRSSGKLRFLLIRDGSGLCQCVVFKKDVSEDTFAAADALTQESSVEVTGTVRAEPRSPGGYELGVSEVQTIHLSHDFPITPKEHGVEFLADRRHLWIRSSRQQAILRVRHTLMKAIHDFFDSRGFLRFDAPIFTPAACEGTSTLFETPYFDEGSAYLTQSGQLYGEAGALAFGKVYVFGPVFRAEKSKTRKHLTEFWMVEPEVAFCDLEQDMDLMEEFLEHLVQTCLRERRPELELLERDIAALEQVQRPFPRIHYDEAVRLLNEELGEPMTWGDDFGAPHETALGNHFAPRPVMIHDWPVEVKAFYFKRTADGKYARGCDVIAPEGFGEIIGGGQREDDYDALLARIEEHKLPREAFDWYLDLRKYGSVPHAGFGLGVERTVAYICGIPHVRETLPFPRMMGRLTP